MKIGLISDTHGYLDPAVFKYFSACDEIWHAGDIGTAAVVDALEQFKPLKAVFGNIDDKTMQARFPEDLWFTCEGKTILITHIAGKPPRYNARIKKMLASRGPDLLICGHSHILKVMHDATHNLLFINPGAAGNHGFHHIKTLIRFDLTSKGPADMEVIELGKRGALTP